MTNPTVVIDVISDVICPWCYLGKRRLEKAIDSIKAQDPAVELHVRYHPHFLSPELLKRPQTSIPKREVYLRRFNGNEKAVENMVLQFKQLFEVEGIQYCFEGEVSHSLHAHRLIEYATRTKGEVVAARVVDLLFAKYHSQGQNIAKLETLLDVANKCELDFESTKSFLESDGLVNEVLDEVVSQTSRYQSLTGVPHFKITVNSADSFEIPGAQEAAFFERTILKLIDLSCHANL